MLRATRREAGDARVPASEVTRAGGVTMMRPLGVAADHQKRSDREGGGGVSGEECEPDPG